MPTKPFEKLADDLAVLRGAAVSSADCSAMEIAQAQACGRLYVNAAGLGFVLRPAGRDLTQDGVSRSVLA
jgi:hypothetical protein